MRKVMKAAGQTLFFVQNRPIKFDEKEPFGDAFHLLADDDKYRGKSLKSKIYNAQFKELKTG